MLIFARLGPRDAARPCPTPDDQAEAHARRRPAWSRQSEQQDPGNKGFEWAGGGETIASVAITAPDTVAITLSAAPAAAGRLRYAFTGTSGALGGPTTGPRGNLSDSDATPSRFGYPLHNWCIHFDQPVP